MKGINDSLLNKLGEGNDVAIGEVYDSYVDSIYRFILLKVSSGWVAEDLTSECFLKFIRHIKEGNKVENPRALLYQIARNVVIDWWRKKSIETVPFEYVDESSGFMKRKGDDKIDQSILLQHLERLLPELKDDWRELVTLRYVEQYTIQEVSEITGKKESTVRVSLHRAIKALQKKLSAVIGPQDQ